jgi:hypothetical protein
VQAGGVVAEHIRLNSPAAPPEQTSPVKSSAGGGFARYRVSSSPVFREAGWYRGVSFVPDWAKDYFFNILLMEV